MGPRGASLRRVADPGRRGPHRGDQGEGTIIQRVGGEWYLFASDGDARNFPVYDLAMRKWALDAPYGDIPHPMLVQVGASGG
ncbi:hypothetical protein K7G98_00740 [Saccharothrix sp. MB29]|nr:hypothetical protein [Saccharothrix sp. MB29]